MLALLTIGAGGLLGVIVMIVVGATIYHLTTHRKSPLNERDHTRSTDWTDH